MKQMGLSAIAAATLVTAGMAGTVSTSSVGLIGQERLSLDDVNLSDATGGAVYTPTDIKAGTLKNPIFKFTFANAKNLVPDANLSIYEVKDGNDSNRSAGNLRWVANNAQVSGANNEVVTFTAVSGDIYVYNNKKYVFMDGNDTNVSDAVLKATVVKGSTGDVTLAASLWTGDSQEEADEAAPSTIAQVGNEFIASVKQKFDARIDASNGFKTFYDQYEDINGATDNNRKDTLTMDITRKTVISTAAGLVNPQIGVVVFQDTNLTQNGYTVAGIYSRADVTGTANDYNATMDLANAVAADDTTPQPYKVEYTVDGNSKIEKTDFGVQLWVQDANGNQFTKIVKTNNNAGAWTIYGYNAQIPGVMDNPDLKISTTLKFTNRSGLNADVFFTLIDQAGNVVTVDSVNDGLAAIPANFTQSYKAADLLKIALQKNTDFAGAGKESFSVEVSIPTTPSQVYGFASFKNKQGATPAFKDLPIYNTSNMTY